MIEFIPIETHLDESVGVLVAQLEHLPGELAHGAVELVSAGHIQDVSLCYDKDYVRIIDLSDYS